MTQTISFETKIENGYIKVPFSNAVDNAKVIIVWNDNREKNKNKSLKLPCLNIDMAGYKFDRDEANER
jgi:hypothetical protein